MRRRKAHGVLASFFRQRGRQRALGPCDSRRRAVCQRSPPRGLDLALRAGDTRRDSRCRSDSVRDLVRSSEQPLEHARKCANWQPSRQLRNERGRRCGRDTDRRGADGSARSRGEARAGGIFISQAEVRQLPGAFGDPFRAIEALPGVTPIVSGLPFSTFGAPHPATSATFSTA